MTKRLRYLDRWAVDAAIAAGEQPRAPKASRGLIVSIPGGRYRRLMDNRGELTAAGEYFFETSAQRAPDRGFDYGQQPV